MITKTKQYWFLPVLLFTVVLNGCAVNPVSGKSELALISEEKELKLGRKNDKIIRKQYGVYENKKLQAYVNRIGQRLAKLSHRPNIKYTFTVLGSPEVNAFALPGGYIYITRGIMSYINSEAELAAILGHEIGHVTARHGVQQYSKATATSWGITIASILVPELQNDVSQQLLNVLGSAMISGYGREAELEADRLGARYLAREGYRPDAMIDVIGVLKNQEEFEKESAKREKREPRVYHGVFASHPSADKRLQRIVAQAKKISTKARHNGVAERQRYLAQVNGLVFGDSVAQGIRRNNHFYHRALGMTLTFPEEWHIKNLPTQLIAYHPDKQALVDVRLVEYKNKKLPTPKTLVKEKLKAKELTGSALAGTDLPSFSTVRKQRTPWGKRKTRVSVVYLNNRAYLIYGAAKTEQRLKELDSLFLQTAASLRALNTNEKKLASGLRIKVVRARPGKTFADYARTSPQPDYPELMLRLINNKFPKGEPVKGERIKLIQ